MYRKMVRSLRGQLTVAIESPCPERVVNLCAVHGIPFWDLRWQGEGRCTLCTTRRGWRRIQQVTEEVDCRLRLLKETGVPVTCRRLGCRWVLLFGLALGMTLLVWARVCIWEFRVSGNDTVPSQEILRALEAYGVRVGSFGRNINQREMRNHVLLEVPDLAWLTVHVRGCVGYVQVVERHRPPKRVEEHLLSNVVSRRSGIVTKISALDGEARVAVGDTVTEGQLLISGVVDSTRHGVRWLHGMGTVEGRTWPEITVWTPRKAQRRTARQKRQFYSLNFGKYRLKFGQKGRKIGPECDKITRYKPWTLPGGLRLPFTWVTETVTYNAVMPRTRSEARTRQEGEALAQQLLRQRLGETGQVIRQRLTTARRPGWIAVTLHAECREELGEEVLLPAPELE